MANTAKFFNPGSTGFVYAVITTALSIFAASGVTFPKVPSELGTELVNSYSTGGVYALIGVMVASVIFPIYNAIQAKTFSLKGIFSRNTTWIALGNLAIAAIALTGFVLPNGTVEQVVGAVSLKDWGAVISIIGLNVVNTLLRYIKDQAPEITA